VTALPGFRRWRLRRFRTSVRQLAAPILAPRDGMRCWTLAPAARGKSAHLLEVAQIELHALDLRRGAAAARP
jgi:16S rRNA (cytosine967-C5)-methyltransferase